MAAAVAVGVIVATPSIHASPADEYSRAHFGKDIPPGCKRDTMLSTTAQNMCHHMRTGLNGLDSPIVDVLIVVPVSPNAERDSRIMRQAVEMWKGGVQYLAPQMGLDWLGKGVKFRITVDTVNPTSERFSLFPVVDPEIVVIATNPIGALGIGIDPVATAGQLGDEVLPLFLARDDIVIPRDVPCSGYGEWLFSFGFWDSLPGFDSHHEGRSGTYTEDCGGGGGNVCFAVNTASEPSPNRKNANSLFDLVAHEFGHCLTLGHVGDGAEGPWNKVPENDIMAYNDAPIGLTKCVSTLDVEVFATRMSNYLDSNGDGRNARSDVLTVNDPVGDLLNPFQTQHPRDHFYASRSGDPRDCPQPGLGSVPAPRTDWTPDPVATGKRTIALTSPASGARSSDSAAVVSGTVRRASSQPMASARPPKKAGSPATNARPRTVTFRHPDGNTFEPQDSELGTEQNSHAFTLDVAEPSDITFRLGWRDATGLNDLDLYVSGAADSGFEGGTGGNPETVTFKEVQGHFDIRVAPYLVARSLTYTLTAAIKPAIPVLDSDGDDTPDNADVCIDRPGTGGDGCPMRATERVLVYLDDSERPAATQDVDTTEGADRFGLRVAVPKGTHRIKVVWASTKGKVYATETVSITRS